MTHKRKKKAPAKRKQTTRTPPVKLSTQQKQGIVKQFLTPAEIAKRTGSTKKTAASWIKSKKLTDKAEKKISKLASEILASEKRKARKENYDLPPPDILFRPERLKRKNYLTKKYEDSDNVAFNVPDARTNAAKEKSERWLDWARQQGYTLRAVYKVGESGLGVDREAYPSEIRSTSYINLGSISNKRFEQFKKSLTDDKGRYVKRFVIAQ